MKLKTVEVEGKTYAEVQDGKPVFVADDGKEVAFDAPGTVATITRLNSEAKGHREGKEAAEKALKDFEGITDPAAARTAIETLSKIDAKKLVEAGDMDSAIQTALKPVQEELAVERKKNETLAGSLDKAVIGNAFGQSKFVAEKLTPAGADLVRALYADRIKVDDGKLVGLDANGQKMYSKARPGEMADFDEIVESIVEHYPNKDHILKGSAASGGGTGGQNNGGSGGGKSAMTREQFNGLDPAAQAKAAQEATITD